MNQLLQKFGAATAVGFVVFLLGWKFVPFLGATDSFVVGLVIAVVIGGWSILSSLFGGDGTTTDGTTTVVTASGGGSVVGTVWSFVITISVIVPTVIVGLHFLMPSGVGSFWFYSSLGAGLVMSLVAYGLLGGASRGAAKGFAGFMIVVFVASFIGNLLADRAADAQKFDVYMSMGKGGLNVWTDPFSPVHIESGQVVRVKVVGGEYTFAKLAQGTQPNVKSYYAKGDPSDIRQGLPKGRLRLGIRVNSSGNNTVFDHQTFMYEGEEGGEIVGVVPMSSSGGVMEGELVFMPNFDVAPGEVAAASGMVRVRVTLDEVRAEFGRNAERTYKKFRYKYGSIPIKLMGPNVPVLVNLAEIERTNPNQNWKFDFPSGVVVVTPDGKEHDPSEQLGPQLRIWLKGPKGKVAYLRNNGRARGRR